MPKEGPKEEPKVKVSVKAVPATGFRRAGYQFAREGQEISVDQKTLEILQAEPMLVVTVLPPEDPQPPADEGDGKKGKGK